MKRVFIYVRVSTQEQAHEGYSIDEQIDRLKAFCDAHRWNILNVYTDAGYSGAKLDRPALQDMLKNLKKADAVVVYKLDRLSRSQKDTLELIEDHFLKNGVDFISMSENFDTGTPFGRAMIGILAVFAQLEREQIKERMTMGREGRAKEGHFHGGGFAPIGYDYQEGELIINPFEAMQVKEIHDLYQGGKSFREIDRIFSAKGYVHKFGQWTPKRIRSVMTSDIYTGAVHFNGKTFEGKHDPIIDRQTFDASMRIYRSHDYSSCRNNGQTATLSGLLFCRQCGARYAFTCNKKADGRVYNYYACHSRRKKNRSMVKDAGCKNKIWKMEELDKLIFDQIRKLAIDPSAIDDIKKDAPQEANKAVLIAKEIERINNQRSRFLDLYGTGTFSMDELLAKTKPLDEQKQKLTEELERLNESTMTQDEVNKIVTSFDDVLASSDTDRIRLLIRSLIDRIEIDEEDIYIHWKFA